MNGDSAADGASRRWRLARLGAQIVAALVAAAVIPAWWSGRDADALYRGELEAQRPLADAVAHHALAGADEGAVSYTGHPLFDAEWELVTCQMTVLGLANVIEQHPELCDVYLPAMERCLDRMLEPRTLRFGTEAWGEGGARAEEASPRAWLGYVNVALGAHRRLVPRSRFSATHDRVTANLARALEEEPIHALQTYPGEVFPADISTVIASVHAWDEATGGDHRTLIKKSVNELERLATDPASGLLAQTLDPETGARSSRARGSGTAFTAWFLKDAAPETSRRLWRSIVQAELLGFGGATEYPPGTPVDFGDVDSGPVLLNVGTSTTGFSIALARAHGDEDSYRRMVRTAWLFGVPATDAHGRRFIVGGPIGDALLLAALTTPPPRLTARIETP